MRCQHETPDEIIRGTLEEILSEAQTRRSRSDTQQVSGAAGVYRWTYGHVGMDTGYAQVGGKTCGRNRLGLGLGK